MKKNLINIIIWIFILIFLIIAINKNLIAGELYLESTKQTNGGYNWKIPAISTKLKKNKFIYKPELALLFTSPRAMMSNINHHSFDLNNNFGIEHNDFFFTFSLGIRYIFKGNDDNIQEGIEFYNTLRVGIEF